MIYAGIGLIVGIIMGLTGAGGALVSIPLFISLLGISLKEATILSLIAVIFGTSLNLIKHLGKIDFKIAFSIALSGVVANYMTLFLKASTPDSVVAVLLIIVALYSLWSVWSHKSKDNLRPVTKNFIIIKGIGAGLVVGTLTTLTGLGGGVILIPILLKLFGKTYHEALPTSLATILVISLSSFIFQWEHALPIISVNQILFLGAGALMAILLVNLMTKKLSQNNIEAIRKITFSLVTSYSVLSVILKTW